MAGSAIYLPLLHCTSLSSGSGDCTSLLLGGMVNSSSPLLCYRKQRTFLCSDTKLMQPHPQACPLIGSSYSHGLKNSNVLLFPYREIRTHRTLERSLLFTYRGIGLHGIARSMVGRWSLRSLKPNHQSTLTFPLPIGTSPIMIS
jgi:hypothetical protein